MEKTLIEDAESHGWSREIERHQATATKIIQLLTDLGELEKRTEVVTTQDD